jgi:hypothetical protein
MATAFPTPTPTGRRIARTARGIGVFLTTAAKVLLLGKHGVD